MTKQEHIHYWLTSANDDITKAEQLFKTKIIFNDAKQIGRWLHSKMQ
jgi:hypothetical protein